MSPILVTILQHAEEASVLWILRDLAVGAPHYDLADLTTLDRRLDAHIDGLRVAGEAGRAVTAQELTWEEPGEVFVSSVLAMEAGDEYRVDAAFDVGVSTPELARAATSALGWLSRDQALEWVERLADSEDPARRRMAIGGAAVHRHDLGEDLGEAIRGEAVPPRARALKAAGELGRVDLLAECQAHYDSENEAAGFWSAWSGSLLGDQRAAGALAQIAVGGGPRARQAADLAARRLPLAEAHAWRDLLAAEQAHRRLAIVVAGATCDPAVVPFLLEMMEIDELARPAGEAFSAITGVDLVYEDLEAEWPESFEAGPTEDPEDADVSLDEDENLPWPDAELLKDWWSRHGGRYAIGTRYLLGRPLSHRDLKEVLIRGRQRQRLAGALELALSDPALPLFQCRAPGGRQAASLSLGKR